MLHRNMWHWLKFQSIEYMERPHYVWILDFLRFGSNATDDRLVLEMYI